jgi:precorrin-6A/cobalt-precorrin-6A reductase
MTKPRGSDTVQTPFIHAAKMWQNGQERIVMRILILGGTGEARALAERLDSLGHEVVTSLAGRTSDPILPKGGIRVGKFGGIAGLVAYLRAARIERLVDATHPYAGLISINAVAAAKTYGIPLVRLMRPAWPQPEGANWTLVDSLPAAASALPPAATVLLTTGHAGLETFLERDDCRFLVRLIEPPDFPVPAHARLILSRPPYSLADEENLLRSEEVTHLVTKNSGGAQTRAKLDAARNLGVAVIMIARPAYGPATEVNTVEAAIAALDPG